MFDFDELDAAVSVGADSTLGSGEAAESGSGDEGANVTEAVMGGEALESEPHEAVHPVRSSAGVQEPLASGEACRAEALASKLLLSAPAPARAEAFELRKVRLQAMLHPEFRPPPGTASPSGQALALAQSLASERPADASLPALLGRALHCAGRRKEAAAVLERSAAGEGPEGEVRQLLRSLAVAEDEKKRGNAAFKDAQWETACAAYTRAAEADVLRVDREMAAAVLGNRSAARRKLAMYDDALADAEESLRLWPGYTKARFRRALVLMQFERYAEALADLRVVQREDPSIAGLSEWVLRAEHWGASKQKNHYVVLGAPMDATPEEIKRAHKRMALKWHPDKASAGCSKELCEERFKAIQEAFEFLSAQDAHRRDLYDFGKIIPRQPEQRPHTGQSAAYASKREPMPKQLVKMGFGTIRKGDGITTCLCCGKYAETYWEKKHHVIVTDHPGFFDSDKAQKSRK